MKETIPKKQICMIQIIKHAVNIIHVNRATIRIEDSNCLDKRTINKRTNCINKNFRIPKLLWIIEKTLKKLKTTVSLKIVLMKIGKMKKNYQTWNMCKCIL